MSNACKECWSQSVAVPQGAWGALPPIFSCHPPSLPPKNNFKCLRHEPKFDNFNIELAKCLRFPFIFCISAPLNNFLSPQNFDVGATTGHSVQGICLFPYLSANGNCCIFWGALGIISYCWARVGYRLYLVEELILIHGEAAGRTVYDVFETKYVTHHIKTGHLLVECISRY